MFRESVTINCATAFPPPPKGTEGSKVTPMQCVALVPTLCDHLCSLNSCSVQFRCSVMSDSLQPHGLQHARPPCPSPTSTVNSNSCPLSQWCHPAISSSVIPFSSCPQSSPASGSFPVSQFFPSGGQNVGVSVSALVNDEFTSNEYSGLISFRMDWLDILAVQGTLKNLLQHHSSKESILLCSAFFIVQLSYPYIATGKTIALTNRPLLAK